MQTPISPVFTSLNFEITPDTRLKTGSVFFLSSFSPAENKPGTFGKLSPNGKLLTRVLGKLSAVGECVSGTLGEFSPNGKLLKKTFGTLSAVGESIPGTFGAFSAVGKSFKRTLETFFAKGNYINQGSFLFSAYNES